MTVTLGTLGLMGCTQTLHLSSPIDETATATPPEVPPAEASAPQPRKRLWVNHFLLGFVGRKTIDVRDHCEARPVTEIRLSHDPLTVLIWTVTVGLYTPRRLSITCGSEVRSP